MARSYKKTPAGGITTAPSDKEGKVRSMRRWRSRVRQALRTGQEPPLEKEIRQPWDWPKDGKRFYLEAYDEDLSEWAKKQFWRK